MATHNAANEIAKRNYLEWLGDAQGRTEATLDSVAAAIARFEAHVGYRDFKTFRREQAMSFKRELVDARHPRSGKPLAKATLVSTLNNVRGFFEWLAREQPYRSKIVPSDVAYFRPTDHDARIATAKRERPAPSLLQVQHVLASMPTDTVVQRRDRAVVALILLTGARDAAVASLPLKRLDLANGCLSQDARDVKTKGRKTFSTWFYPVGDEAMDAVTEWVQELTAQHLFGPDDPLFPVTARGLDADGRFAAAGIERRFWTSADPIRAIFRKAFEAAGLPNYGPHSIRRTLTRLAYDRNLSLRALKVWSQGLGHDSVLTTLGSYGTIGAAEQAEVMASLRKKPAERVDQAVELARLILAQSASEA